MRHKGLAPFLGIAEFIRFWFREDTSYGFFFRRISNSLNLWKAVPGTSKSKSKPLKGQFCGWFLELMDQWTMDHGLRVWAMDPSICYASSDHHHDLTARPCKTSPSEDTERVVWGPPVFLHANLMMIFLGPWKGYQRNIDKAASIVWLSVKTVPSRKLEMVWILFNY